MATPAQEAGASKAGLPTLHHLNNSQSQRVLWLLEELGIEYNLVSYLRVGDRAPPALEKIHPLGKAPTFVTADGRTLIETSVIVTYLLSTYDSAGKFATTDKLREETLVSFSGTTLGPLNVVELFLELLPKHSPWPVSALLRTVHKMVQKQYSRPEYKKDLTWLEEQLGGADWFNGQSLGKSDVMISWPLDNMAQRHWVNFEKDYPKIAAWRARVEAREAWKRGLEKGNGYDLNAA